MRFANTVRTIAHLSYDLNIWKINYIFYLDKRLTRFSWKIIWAKSRCKNDSASIKQFCKSCNNNFLFWMSSNINSDLNLCSPPISSWHEHFSSLRNTFFFIISYFLQWVLSTIISKMIKLACNCLINCYLQDMVRNLVIFDISIFAKGVHFGPSWLEKEKQLNWLGKKNTFLQI